MAMFCGNTGCHARELVCGYIHVIVPNESGTINDLLYNMGVFCINIIYEVLPRIIPEKLSVTDNVFCLQSLVQTYISKPEVDSMSCMWT